MSWNQASEILADTLPGYESRPEQDGLAHQIETALVERVHLLAQAGCGTGKSLANLIPAIARAKVTGKPVVISTATKALQAQYVAKDLPFVAENLAPLFGEITFALLKGRGNYVCLAKLNDEKSGEVRGIDSIRQELEANDNAHDGDVERLLTELYDGDKGKITSTGDECPGKRECPFGEVCYAEAARARAQEVHVVVVNHALLVRDILVRQATAGSGALLPDYDSLFIDEGHELEDYATSALGQELSERGLLRFGSDVENFLDGDVHNAIPGAAKELFELLDQTLARNTTLTIDDELLVALYPLVERVLQSVIDLGTQVHGTRPTNDQQAMRRKQLLRRVGGMKERLNAILGLDEDGDEEIPAIVRWIEREERTVRGQKQATVKLQFAPLSVAPFLAENLWSETTAVITSATLAVGTDFDYIVSRLGLGDYAYETFDAGSPFDFTKQARLYVPAGGYPEPSGRTSEEWGARSVAEMGELVNAAGGRSLLLFTSRRAMLAAARVLQGGFARRGYTVLIQDGHTSTARLTEQFKDDETSVLFALKSFMTGADFQGDTCRLVILDKLPFAVPTDVIIQARAEAIDAVARNKWVDGSFPTYTVPSMALTLLQAFGRAVRTKNDHALIAILDPRLRTKKYGGTILRALPPAPKLDDLADARSYLFELADDGE